MSEGLLPCPFCGGKAKLITDTHGPDFVNCVDCGVCVHPDEWNRRTLAPTEERKMPEGPLVSDLCQMPLSEQVGKLMAYCQELRTYAAGRDERDSWHQWPRFAIRLASPNHVVKGRTTVDIEIHGKWYVLIEESGDIFCHIKEPLGTQAIIDAALKTPGV